MIQGRFGEKGEIYFDIELITSDGLNLPVECMLDTGFTGFMAINTQDLDSLEWDYLDKEIMRTAQGEKSLKDM